MQARMRVVAFVAAGAALFGAGVLVAGWGQEEAAPAVSEAALAQVRASDGQILNQIVAEAGTFQSLVEQAQRPGLSNSQQAVIAVRIQQLGGRIEGFGASLSQPDMQSAARRIGEGYIAVGVGVVLNDQERVKAAFTEIGAATEDLAALARDLAPSPSPSPSPSPTAP